MRPSLFILLQLCLLVRAEAADSPVTKPLPGGPKQSPAESRRLSAPAPVIAEQRSDGLIEVRWTALEDALRYQLTRTSADQAPMVMELPIGGPSVFRDSRIMQGKTYYYVVAGIDRAGTLGLKAGSQPVRAMLPLGGAPTVRSFHARQERPNVVTLRWHLSGNSITPMRARIERIALSPAMPPRIVTEMDARAGTFRDSSLPAELREVQYRVTIDRGRPMSSNIVTLTGATAGTTDTTDTAGTTGSTSGPATAAAIGSATFTAATPVTVRVGATVASGGGGGTRVLSLNEAVARVDAAGAITGVAPGSTHVVSLSGSEGSLRVVAVQVTVTN